MKLRNASIFVVNLAVTMNYLDLFGALKVDGSFSLFVGSFLFYSISCIIC